jgi:poly-gamma-glutamate synthesis protein (capsule biosynthesis protein)
LSAPGVTAEFSEQAARNQQLYAPPSEPLRASFVAVGDNLIHGSIYRTHATGDGGYSFDDIYAPVKEAIEAADVAYINQETVCGGTELGLADYPCFNSPHQILDALSNAGFDWLNTASNHSMDVGEAGILSQLAYLETLPNLTETGTHASAEAAAPTIIEAGGIRVGLASYTYGLNGFILPEGKDYLVNLIDWDGIARDIGALAQASDVQIVSMHWGAEYRHTPTDEQVALAQYLSDLGVDVVIGAHPHVVEPTTMITGEQGNRTLVIYSLGNFLSAQDEPPRMLGEMASWTITYNPHSGEVGIENVEILPTVTHIYAGYSGFEIYLLRDYTDALASQHLLAHQGLTRDYLVGLANDVFGGEFPVIY